MSQSPPAPCIEPSRYRNVVDSPPLRVTRSCHLFPSICPADVTTPVVGWSPELLNDSVTNEPTAALHAASLEYVTSAANAVVAQRTMGRVRTSDHFFISISSMSGV